MRPLGDAFLEFIEEFEKVAAILGDGVDAEVREEFFAHIFWDRKSS